MISDRIRGEIEEALEEGGVDTGEEVRRVLEELAWRVKARRFIELWNELLKDVKPSEKGFSVKGVREDRESH
jgi:hypothetical protein